jgi:acetoin utilization deacetylase AcuC-like enzyme
MVDLVLFYPEGHEAHAEPDHPERPERVEAIRSALEAQGWWEAYPHLQPMELPEAVITGVHSADYLERLKQVCWRGAHFDADTYTTPPSWHLAQNAAGGAASVAAAVWLRSARRGFALTRPPGHHATRDQAMGFCLLNNVAVAAEYLVQKEGAQRLAIVDLDLHHGNGTQDIFYERGDVFYFSTHQWPLYPGTGGVEETGFGPGEATTANFPMPPFSGDQAFQTVMDELIIPLLDRYQPEMILVSYGFDPHYHDPLGNLRLTASGYRHLVARLSEWADANCEGRIALFLEGGYDLQAAKACTLAVVGALLGMPGGTEGINGPEPVKEGTAWKSMVQRAKSLWNL